MTDTGHLMRKVNMTITQDWSKVRGACDRILKKINNGELDKYKKAGGYGLADQATDYDIGSYGKMSITMGWSDREWLFWNGKYLHSLFPWYPQAVDYFNDVILEDIMWVVNYNSIYEHIDMKHKNDTEDPDDPPQCKLTYIVSSEDPNAYTISRDVADHSIVDQYQSTVGTAWLLHTGHLHGVYTKPNMKREILQFKFASKYSEVCELLDRKGPINFK